MSVERYSQPVIKLHHPTATGSPVPLIPDAEGKWVKYEDFEATQQQLGQLLEAMKAIADVRSDGTMPGVVEAFERRGEIARGVLAEEIEKERKS